MTNANVEELRDYLARQCAASRWGEAAAVAVLLGFEPVAGHSRFGRYVDRSGVDWPAMLKDRCWSEHQRFLIATAAGLWTGNPHGADVCKVPFMGDGFYEAWLAMVVASRTGKVPS
jgi:hypothetical protein